MLNFIKLFVGNSVQRPHGDLLPELHPLVRLDGLVSLAFSLESRPDCLEEGVLVSLQGVASLAGESEVGAEDV